MSETEVKAEEDLAQARDDGGDDEVRDGPFRYIHHQSLRSAA